MWSHTMSDLFPVVTGVHQGCVLAPALFSTCMDWILGRIFERSSCVASFGGVKISVLHLADDSHLCEDSGYPFWGPSGRHRMRSRSHWDYGFPGSKLRCRLSMTSSMLLSCLYLFVVMLRSWRDSLTLAVIFMSLLTVTQRSLDIWVGPGESWN